MEIKGMFFSRIKNSWKIVDKKEKMDVYYKKRWLIHSHLQYTAQNHQKPIATLPN